MELAEDQQLLIEQLKELLRKNEKELQEKNKELEDSCSKYQKLKLQSKARITQLTNQLRERNKTISVEESSSTETVPDTTENSEQSNRGKVIMLKKQLEDAKQIFDKTEKELTAEKSFLENTLRKLETELDDKDKVIKSLQNELKVAKSVRTEETSNAKDIHSIQEMYAQMVYKDSKIIELNELVSEKERTILDLQEHIKEKNEVLKTRNQAIQLMTEDLNRKGKSVVDQLDLTRDEMRLMQENFISKENDWKEEKQQLEKSIDLIEDKHQKLLQDKNVEIKQLEENIEKLEKVRFELATKNGELQEKLVQIQNEFMHLKKVVETERIEKDELRKTLKETENLTDEKILRARVKERKKLKALERELETVKKENDSRETASLKLQIAELEEEKGSLQLKLLEMEENSYIQNSENNKNINTVQRNEFEIDNLKREFEQKIILLETENKDLEAILNETKKTLEEIRKDYEEKELHHKELLTDFQALQKTEQQKQIELENLQYLVNEKDSELIQLIDDVNSIKAEKVTLEMRIIELEEQKEVKEKYEEELLEENKHLKDLLVKEKEALISVNAEKNNALTEVEEMKIIHDAEKVNIEKLKINLATIQSCYDEVFQENNCLQKDVNFKKKEVEEKSIEIADLNQKLNEINLDFNEQKEKYENKLKEFFEKETELSLFFKKYSIASISDLQRKWEENADQLHEMKTSLESEMNQSNMRSLEIKELQSLLKETENSLKNEINYLNFELEKSNAEKEYFNQLISEKEKLLIDAENALHEKEACLLELIENKDSTNKLTSEMKKLRTETDENLQKAFQEKLELLKKLEEYKIEISELKDQLNKYEVLYINLQEEFNNKNLENENIIAELNKNIEELRNKWLNINNCLLINNDNENNLSTEEKIIELLADNEKNKISVQNLQHELKNLFSKHQEFKEQLSISKHENQTLQNHFEKLQSHAQDLNAEIMIYKNNESKYQEEIKKLNQINKELIDKNDCLLKMNNDIKKENDILLDKLNDIKTKYSEVISYNEEIEKEILLKATELNNCLNKIEQFEKQVQILSNDKQVGMKSNDGLKHVLNEKEKFIEQLENILKQKENEIIEFNKLQVTFEKQTNELQRTNENLQFLQCELDTKKSVIYEMENRIQEMEISLEKLEEEKSNLIKQMKIKENNYSDLVEKCKETEQKNLDLENNIKLIIEETEQKSLNKCIIELQDLQNKLESSNVLNRKLENQLKSIIQSNKEYQSEIFALNEIITNKTKETEDLKSKNKDINDEYNHLQNQLEKIMLEKKALMDELDMHKENNISHLKEISFLQSEEIKYKETLSKLEKENQTLSNLLKEMTDKSENLSSELLQSVSCTNVLQQELEELKYNFDNSKHLTEKKIQKSVEQNKLLEEINNNLETKIEKLHLENNQKEMYANSLKDELHSYEIQLNDKKEEIESLNEQIKCFQKSSHCMKNDIERLQFFEAEYHNLVKCNQNLEEELKLKVKSIENIKEENEKLVIHLKSESDKLDALLKEKSHELEITIKSFSEERNIYQQEIKNLQDKLLNFDTSSKETKQIISELENSLQENEELLIKQKNELEKYQDYQKETDSRISSLELGLRKKEEECKQIAHENLKLIHEIKDFQKENESLHETQMQVISKENESDLKIQLQTYKDQIAIIQESSEYNIQVLSAKLEAANNKICNQESKISLFEKDIETKQKLLTEINYLKQNIDELNNYYNKEKLKVNELNSMLEEKEILINDLKERINILEEKNNQSGTKLLEFQNKVEDQTSQINSIMLEKNEITNKYENEIIKQHQKIEEIQHENLLEKEEINNLNKKLENLMTENIELKNFNEILQNEIKKHEEVTLKYDFESETLKAQYKELQSINSSLTESVQTLMNEKEQQNTLHELQNLNNGLECEVQSLRAEFCKLEEERNYLSNCVNEMTRKIENLETNNKEYMLENSTILKQIDILKSKNCQLLHEIEKIDKLNKEFEKSTIEALKIDMENYAAENLELKKKLEELQSNEECELLKLEIKENKNKIFLMESEIKNREIELKDLKNKFDSKKELEQKFLKIEDLLSKSDNERISLQNKVIELENQIENKNLELEKLQYEYNRLENFEKQDHENSRNNYKENKQIKEIDNAILIEKEIYQRNETDSNQQKLIKENETMKANLDVQKIKLEKMFAKLKAFKEKNDQLQDEIQTINEKIFSLEKEKEKYENSLSNKTEIINNFQKHMEESENFHKQEISKKENLIMELKEHNVKLNEKCQQLEYTLMEKKEIIENIQLCLDKRNKELEDLSKRLKEMNENQIHQEETANNYLRQYNQLIYEKESLQHEFQDLKQQMEMLVSDNEIFQGMVENLQKTKIVLETDIQKLKEYHAKTIKDMKNAYLQENSKLKEILEQNELAISTLKKQYKETETKHQNLSGDKFLQKDKNLSIMEENLQLKEELEQLKQEMSSLKAFAAWDSDNETNKNMLEDEILKEVETLQKDKELLERELTVLKDNKCDLQKEINDLEEKLNHQEMNYTLKFQDMENVIQTLTHQLNESIASNKLLTCDLENKQKLWNNELNIWLQKEDALQFNIRSLEEELKKSKTISKPISEINPLDINISNECCIKSTDKLTKELEQAMYCLHKQSLRNENLSQEISKLIEERNTLQQKFSYYLQTIRAKEHMQYQHSSQTAILDNLHSDQEVTHNSQTESKKLQERIENAEMNCEELRKINETLNKELEKEKAKCRFIQEELKNAKEEIILNSSSPRNNEFRLLIEDEPGIMPETNYSIKNFPARTVKSHAYRIHHWLRRNRNQCYRTLRRTPFVKISFCIYLLIVHIWLLTCLF